MKFSKLFTRSTLGTACAGLLTLMTALPSHANESDRIARLEKQVQELTLRLSHLEAQRSATGSSAQQTTTAPSSAAPVRPAQVAQTAPTPVKSDPKVSAKWRGLEKGMGPDEVRAVLGAPLKTMNSSAFTYWDYANQGSVTFHHGRLNGWSEPN